jgi:hypothetical protein
VISEAGRGIKHALKKTKLTVDIVLIRRTEKKRQVARQRHRGEHTEVYLKYIQIEWTRFIWLGIGTTEMYI